MIKDLLPSSGIFSRGWLSSTKSVSGWEKSFYGGYSRTIDDHPYLDFDSKLEFEINDFDFKDKEFLDLYSIKKLCRIFLYIANKEGYTEYLIKSAKVETIKKESFFNSTEIKILVVDKNVVNEVLGGLTNRELTPLFNYYSDLIINTKIFIEIPEDKPENKKKSESTEENEDENESKDNNESESESASTSKSEFKDTTKDVETLNEKRAQLRELLEKIKPYKSYSFFNKDSHSRDFDNILSVLMPKKKYETVFTAKQILNATNLVKLLDIDFESKPDIVKNLKLGKMDISKIAEVPAGNVQIYQQTLEEQQTQPFSFVILCDESGSMTGSKQITQIELVKTLYYALSQILPQEKIYIYGHSGDHIPEIRIYQDLHYQEFPFTVDNMIDNNYQQNYDGPIILDIHKRVRKMTNDRIILLVLSDGMPAGVDYGNSDDFEDLKRAIEKCKRDEFIPIGIGIQETCVSDLYKYSAVIKNLDESSKIVSRIINHVIKSEFQ